MLAPNAKLRPEIIPNTQKNEKDTSDVQDDAPHSSASIHISWARASKRLILDVLPNDKLLTRLVFVLELHLEDSPPNEHSYRLARPIPR